MLVRIMSDLHLEKDKTNTFVIPPMKNDKNTILVLAGDIGSVHTTKLSETFIPFLMSCNLQFRKVILIVGNHEHYDGNFDMTIPLLDKAIYDAYLTNIVLLNNEDIVIDDVAFIGSTLWTDCNRDDPLAVIAYRGMEGDSTIKTRACSESPSMRSFNANDTLYQHKISKQFIISSIEKHKSANRKTVVVVHHGVTNKSIHPFYKDNSLNMFFTSEMTETWYDTNPTLIIHGHTHHSIDYLVDDTLNHCQTRVVCNPRGYPGEYKSPFNPTFAVEI